jgi:hypothetical protein
MIEAFDKIVGMAMASGIRKPMIKFYYRTKCSSDQVLGFPNTLGGV